MFRYKVSLSTDITVGSVAGLNVHAACIPPAPPTPQVPTAEVPVPHLMPPGTAMAQNKLTRRVKHRGAGIVQDGHDVGTMVPHIPLVPSVLYPIQTVFSKRKTIFFEPRVRFETRFAAPCNAFAVLPTPMMSCGEPFSMPIGSSVTDQWNTVEFRMSLESYLVSYVAMAVTVLAECVVRGVFKKASAPKSEANTKWELWRQQSWSKTRGGNSIKEIAGKVGVEAGIGLLKLGLTSDDRTASIAIPGGPFMRMSGTVVDGELSFKGTLFGVSRDGNGWSDARDHFNLDQSWGADLG